MSEEKNNTNKSEKVKWIRGNRRFCVDDPCSCCLGKEVFDEVFKECIEINNTEVRMIYINLKEHLDDEIKILSGREFGKEHREKFNFNRLDNSKDVINIIIPDDIYGLNSSYFLNLLVLVLENLVKINLEKSIISSVMKLLCRVLKNILKLL